MASSERLKNTQVTTDLPAAPSCPGKKTGGTLCVFPGFCDVHTHLREPGFSYKETICTGTMSAAAGGFTAVCAMPNLSPVPDCPENLKIEKDIIARDAVINVYPYGALTVGEKGERLSDLEGMAKDVIAFSDDGKGVQSAAMMEEAMRRCRDLEKIVAAHCEDESLLRGGYIHDGDYALKHSHRGICSMSEWRQVERDLELSAKTGCAYHVCHVSTKESVGLIRQAKKSGVDVTCETAPHYLLLCDEDIKEDGRFKMNPPLRSPDDRDALIEALKDGTVDMIATDHAPHTPEEKSRGLEKSPFGIVGLETAFPALYTVLVLKGVIPLEKLIDLMAYAPRRRFGIPLDDGDKCVWDLSEAKKVTGERFVSMGKSTPFEGMTLKGVLKKVYKNSKLIYSAD
ncbi:MAG: dihydroorotase [Clostridia bacterium]|nr:dihydroorotase [Clostridia bacterium]